MESPLTRVRRALIGSDLDRASAAIAYAAIAVGTGLIVYGVIAQ
jgi:hypothetical protein